MSPELDATSDSPDPLDNLDEPAPMLGRDANDLGPIIVNLKSWDSEWEEPDIPLDLGPVRWQPQLRGKSKDWVLHVHMSRKIPNYLARRLVAAAEGGHEVHVACYLEALYDEETLRLLAATDAYVYVLDDVNAARKRRHFLGAMADLAVPVSPSIRKEIATLVWDNLASGESHHKGARLEALLAFLMAQVDDFRIFARNYRNETQEIDIIVQVDSSGSRSWHRNAPFILVESKNTAERIGQPPIALMFRKLETKRGSAKIAIFFSIGGYTSDARMEELRSSTTEFCVAMLDAADILEAISAEDITDLMERKVSEALLR